MISETKVTDEINVSKLTVLLIRHSLTSCPPYLPNSITNFSSKIQLKSNRFRDQNYLYQVYLAVIKLLKFQICCLCKQQKTGCQCDWKSYRYCHLKILLICFYVLAILNLGIDTKQHIFFIIFFNRDTYVKKWSKFYKCSTSINCFKHISLNCFFCFYV